MKKSKRPITLNRKYLDNIKSAMPTSKTLQSLIHNNDSKISHSKIYSILSFKQDIEIRRIIQYLEKEGEPMN